MSSKPNILWILSDQHHADCMGHSQRSEVQTPRLDELARGGVRFTRAYCNSPICAPSRCSMISGQYPHHTGITGNMIHELDVEPPPTLGSVLRGAGYECMLVGKAHMIRLWNEAGFDHLRYCDLIDSNSGDPRHVHYFQHLIEAGLADAYDLGVRDQHQPGHKLERFISEIPLEHTVETWTADQAIKLLRDRDRDKPFMMQLSFQRPHEPLCIPPECSSWYDPATIHIPDSAEDFFTNRFASKPEFQKAYIREDSMGYPYRPRSRDDLRRQLAAYYTLITLIDKQIGRVFDELAHQGQLHNTIICYTADHGDFAGEHGLVLKNLGLYESIHRVPFLLQWPGGPAGLSSEAMIELVDVMPTLLDAAGLRDLIPSSVDGCSRLEEASGQCSGASHVVCEYDFLPRQPRTVAVRTRTHRYVFYPSQPHDIGELYDHTTDPGEIENRWHDPSVRQERLELAELALASISQHSRRWTFHDDLTRTNSNANAAQLLQQHSLRWSDPRTQAALDGF